MYIIFDSEGEETLRYFLEDLPEELKKYEYIEIDEKDIPEKDGYTERARLVDGKLEWEFVEVPKSEEVKLGEIEKLKEENELLQLAIMEIALANKEKTEETELAIAELTNLVGEVL